MTPAQLVMHFNLFPDGAHLDAADEAIRWIENAALERAARAVNERDGDPDLIIRSLMRQRGEARDVR